MKVRILCRYIVVGIMVATSVKNENSIIVLNILSSNFDIPTTIISKKNRQSGLPNIYSDVQVILIHLKNQVQSLN